jgi:dipeptidyl aminopeptidase/acylaminoacyl peptidase
MTRVRALLSLVLLVAPWIAPPSASATFAGDPGTIVFSRGARGVFAIDPSGGAPHRLTNELDTKAVASPNGRRLAFMRTVTTSDGSVTGIAVRRADGNVRWVSPRLRGYPQPPVWSPDGRSIAFEDLVIGQDPATGDETYRSAIWTVRSNGDDPTRVTGYRFRNSHPAWSPDGARIAFDRGDGRNDDIWVLTIDGSSAERITHTDVLEALGGWSPRDELLFARTIPGPPGLGDAGSALVALSMQTRVERTLTDGSVFANNAAWSPDGSRVAFVSLDPATWLQDLRVLGADGSAPRNLTAGVETSVDYDFAWSPDSGAIAFGVAGDIEVADAASGALTPITSGPALDSVGDWQAVAAA